MPFFSFTRYMDYSRKRRRFFLISLFVKAVGGETTFNGVKVYTKLAVTIENRIGVVSVKSTTFENDIDNDR